jgi:predicted dithiol-disulfide oxidoreductase (DUF899 family)
MVEGDTPTEEDTPDVAGLAVDERSWRAALASQVAREKAHTRAGDALAAARRRLPVTPVGEATVRGPDGEIPFVEVFEGRRLLIAYAFMWNHGRPAAEQCPGCTFSVAQLPDQTYLSERDVTLAVLCEGAWPEISAYRSLMGWSHPWYSTARTGDVPAVTGEKYLRCYVRDADRVYLTYETTDRGTEVMDPVLGLLDRTILGRQETWEDSPDGWPQTVPGAWWRRGGRPVAQLERPSSAHVSPAPPSSHPHGRTQACPRH